MIVESVLLLPFSLEDELSTNEDSDSRFHFTYLCKLVNCFSSSSFVCSWCFLSKLWRWMIVSIALVHFYWSREISFSRRISLKTNELLQKVFVQEREIIITFVVSIVNVEHFDHEEVDFSSFAHRVVIFLVNHLWADEFHLLSHFWHALMNWEFPKIKQKRKLTNVKRRNFIEFTRLSVSFLILYCFDCSCWKRLNSSSKSVCCSRSNFLKWFWLYFVRSANSFRCFSKRRAFSSVTCSWNELYSRSSFERRSTLSVRHRSSN